MIQTPKAESSESLVGSGLSLRANWMNIRLKVRVHANEKIDSSANGW